MSTEVRRDERTVAVENASYKWAYTLINYALLLDVMYRGYFLREAAWELLALVIVGGGICAGYQARQEALGKGWARTALIGACVAGAIGAIIAAILV